MESDLDELRAAYEQFQIARAAFVRAANAGLDDPEGVLRALNDLNLAQHHFADTASRMIERLK